MERHEIEGFLAVADELHFGRAADRLLISPARISQTIQKLERRIGAPLFERTSRRVHLTPLGRQLRADIAEHHQAINDGFARAVAAARGVSGVLRLGIMGSYGQLMLDVLDLFNLRHADCEVQMREIVFGDPFRLLREGEVDVAVPWLPVDEPDLTVGPTVGTEQIILAVSSRHPFAERDSVDFEELADETLLRLPRGQAVPEYWIEAHVPQRTPSGRPIPQGATVSTWHELLSQVAAGRAMSFCSEHAKDFYPTPNVSYVPITEQPKVQWGLVWRTSDENHRIRAFAQAAVDAKAADVSAAEDAAPTGTAGRK
ncbi:MAG: LysR family transcriptional regulator [Streptomycetaceae bacterium]|nr:LysR family transcriptional regulator [Streptomycetaceae bacterium]